MYAYFSFTNDNVLYDIIQLSIQNARTDIRLLGAELLKSMVKSRPLLVRQFMLGNVEYCKFISQCIDEDEESSVKTILYEVLTFLLTETPEDKSEITSEHVYYII